MSADSFSDELLSGALDIDSGQETMMSNKDEQAFTVSVYDRAGDKLIVAGGLTKREYAAIKIMAGLAANGNTKEDLLYAPMAVRMADNLFTELEKEPT